MHSGQDRFWCSINVACVLYVAGSGGSYLITVVITKMAKEHLCNGVLRFLNNLLLFTIQDNIISDEPDHKLMRDVLS